MTGIARSPSAGRAEPYNALRAAPLAVFLFLFPEILRPFERCRAFSLLDFTSSSKNFLSRRNR